MPAPQSIADKEKRHAALASVFWALFLTCIKLVAGLATNSLGILSEAMHSALDLVAAGITFFAVRMASKPADMDHPYGHGKIENLSALIETVLLLVTCGWIVREAVERLFFDAPEITPSLWGMGVIGVSLLVDINRSRMLHRVAKKHNSQALEADAMHFTTDIWSSGVVLVGLACVWGASFLPKDHLLTPALHMADAVAALFVSIIVVVVGARLSRRAVDSLLDGGGREHTAILENALAKALPDVVVRRLRVRESGADAFVDLTVEAASTLRLDVAHDMTRHVEKVVHEVLPAADVVVHVEPRSEGNDSILHLARALALGQNLAIHNVVLSMQREGLLVYLHVEVPPDMALCKAHDLVDAFEQELAGRLDGAQVITHIEPEDRLDALRGGTPPPLEPTRIQALLERMLDAFPLVKNPHNVSAYPVGGTPLLSFHCFVPGSLTVAQAHALATRMEQALLHEAPELGRVLIHTDPDLSDSDPSPKV